jgi:hypothetical protein
LTVQVSVNNGTTWYPASNGGEISPASPGASLIYRVHFSSLDDDPISLLYMNITWMALPGVLIVYPESLYYNYVVSAINYTIDVAPGESLDSCWYTLDGGETNHTITCGQNVTGLSSDEGNNTWTVYANYTSGLTGSDSVFFVVDTSAPQIISINLSDEDDETVNSNNPLQQGENLTISANVTDSNLDNVWVVIWENVVGGVEKARLFFTYVAGIALWVTHVETDSSWLNMIYNYTVYANDSAGFVSNYTGTFPMVRMESSLDLNPNPSDGTGYVNASGNFNFSNGTVLANYPFNIWLDGALLFLENLTANGVYQNVLNYTEDKSFFSESDYSGTVYNGVNVTLSGTNTEGNMTGVLDAGAIVEWGNFDWDYAGHACSRTVGYMEGVNGFSGTSDSYINSGSAGTNYGTDASLVLDTSPSIERSLIKFDVFGYGGNKIPYNSTISSAAINVIVYNTGDTPTVYEVLEDWSESDVTYNSRLSGVSWSSTGCGGPPSRSTTIESSVSCATTGRKTFNVLNAARKWSNQTSDNYGVIFNPGGSGSVYFRSSDYGTVNQRPTFNVSFSSDDCTSVRVFIRTSNDKTSWSSWRQINE